MHHLLFDLHIAADKTGRQLYKFRNVTYSIYLMK